MRQIVARHVPDYCVSTPKSLRDLRRIAARVVQDSGRGRPKCCIKTGNVWGCLLDYLDWLRAGSSGHATQPDNGDAFRIVPISEDEHDRRAFQDVAVAALGNAGDGYFAKEHTASEWGLTDWGRTVYDFVAIIPME